MGGYFRRGWAVAVSGALTVTMMLTPAGPAGAQTTPGAPPGQDLAITVGDLDFVLRQIEIGESHAARVAAGNANASPLCSNLATFDEGIFEQIWREPDGSACVGSALLSHGLRTVDGRWNNLQPGQNGYGSARQVFPRLVGPERRAADDVPAGPGVPTVPGQPTAPTTYEQTFGFVYDAEPRIISNTIVDQTTSNPAAVAKLLEFMAEDLDAHVFDLDTREVVDLADVLPAGEEPTVLNVSALEPALGIFIQNVATDEGLSAPFSSFMTIFGQFFDHGLDLIEKGGNGTVVVPLQPDDVLYDPSSNTNFLLLTRATRHQDTEHINRTTPFIDQNQTYTSHASHQVFLREYEFDAEGRPVNTGRLLDAPTPGGGLARWVDVKAQARDILGIELDDFDVHDVPLVVTDPYGHFIPGANGFPQVVIAGTPNSLAEGDLAAPVDASTAVSAGHAFLDDIAHFAAPAGDPTPSPPPPAPQNRTIRVEAGLDPNTPVAGNEYNGALLDAHYATGDGRGNENIALTAAHHIFHAEHNRLIGQIETIIAYDSTLGDESRGLAEGFAAAGHWDRAERMFQAARFFNEMQYQHLAVEEFLRAVAPTMDVQPLNESSYHSDLNSAITAEFANAVYRFGHSMLTETLPRAVLVNGTAQYQDGQLVTEETTLLDGFLNPAAFTKDFTMPPSEAAASLILGLAGQVGNGIDEFVTPTLRNELLGLPLDLATINLARARDTGIPRLQAARQEMFDRSNDPLLKPYADWEEFRINLKHADSIVNFIAAYGTGDAALDAIAQSDVDARRGRAAELVADATYMHRPSAEVGLDDVDLWVGGLAERTMVFGGMLGSTFNYVFETQAELLQNGDRFYYLTRNQGQNFFAQLEGNSFGELIMRNTTAMAVPLDIFTFPNHTFILDALDQIDPTLWPDDLSRLPDGTWRYTGGDHVVFYGTGGDDFIHSGIGDDTIWGGIGGDRIEGDDGNDSLIGGDGDDVITDINGEDKIIAGSGHDVINTGAGGDLVLGGSGGDYVMLVKDDFNDMFAGPGNDIILGGTGFDRVWAGVGDDWLEGGEGHDLLQGDNAIGFQNDPYGGHDVLIGGPGNNDLDSDGGDDILVAGPGLDRAEGMLGFDWVTYKDHVQPVDADMRFTGLLPPDIGAVRDRFDLVEGLSGWIGNDVLRGLTKMDDIPATYPDGHELTPAHLDRVDGLRTLLRPNSTHADYACRFMLGSLVPACDLPISDSDGISNIMLGGPGSDLIEGRAGDDFLDGDSWLNVKLHWVDPVTDAVLGEYDSAAEIREQILDRTIHPADLRIARMIERHVPPAGEIDTAIYTNAHEEYSARYLGSDDIGTGYWEVAHLGAVEVEESDGFDVLRGFEALHFAGTTCVLLPATLPPLDVYVPLTDPTFESCGEFGSAEILPDNPVEDVPVVATVEFNADVTATDVVWVFQHGEVGEADDWEPSAVASTPGPEANQRTFVPGDAEAGRSLRVIVQFTDGDGVQRQIVSPPTVEVVNVNDPPEGPVIVPDSPSVGDMLTAVGLTDGDGIESIIEDGLITYIWQNLVSGSPETGTWETVGSTVTPLFRVPDGALDRRMRVIADYTDDQGTAEQAISPPTQPVTSGGPNNPPQGELVFFPTVPQAGEVIVVETNGISDTDGIRMDLGFSYQWQRPGAGPDTWVNIAGQIAQALQVPAGLVGSPLRVVVSYTDVRGFAEQVTGVTAPVIAADDPAPAAPTGLSAVAGQGQIRLSWVAHPETDVAGYQLYRSASPGIAIGAAGVELVAEVAGRTTTSHVDGSLTPGIRYYYAAAAVDAGGNVSALSAEASAVPTAVPPTPPPVTPPETNPPGGDSFAGFEGVTPARLLDTRSGQPTTDGQGGGSGPLPTGTPLTLQVAGRGGVPDDASAVIVNLTVTQASGTGHLTVWPCDTAMPMASSINYVAGTTVANSIVIKLSGSGTLCVESAGAATQVLVDVTGYFEADTGFEPVVPARLLDTRPGFPTTDGDGAGSNQLQPGTPLVLQVGGRGTVPADAEAAVVNLTVAMPLGPGHLTVWPCDVAMPLASSINYVAGTTVANSIITKLSAAGTVCVQSAGAATQVIADVTGYFEAGSGYGALVPARLLDTRPGGPTTDGNNSGGGPVLPGDVLVLPVRGRGHVPSGASSAVLNLTVTQPAGPGHLTVWPCDMDMPTASSINYGPGTTMANSIVIKLSAQGTVCIQSAGSATHVVADVTGYL